MSELRVFSRIVTETADCESLLDVGSGPCKYIGGLPVLLRAALDADAVALRRAPAGISVIHGLAEEALQHIHGQAFDAVMALDFIEHLAKPTALEVIGEMKRVAKLKLIVFTPDGVHPQDSANPLMVHRSAWCAEDLVSLGFAVEKWADFDYGGGKPPGGLWATWLRDRSTWNADRSPTKSGRPCLVELK